MRLHITITAAVAAALCAPAWAINKCTLEDGKVVYQDAACSTSTKTSATVKTWDNTGNQSETWRFSRQKDSMTGQEICFVVSPTVLTGYRGLGSDFMNVWFQIAKSTVGATALTVRTSDKSNALFHNDISGMGLKIDDKDFLPFSQKIDAHAVGFTDTATNTLLSQVLVGNHMRMRLRFWPYDTLHDTAPLSLVGLRQAYALANACANK